MVNEAIKRGASEKQKNRVKSRKDLITVTSKDELTRLIGQEIQENGYECDLNHLDVSQLKDFSYVFYNYPNWNGDISEWDTMNAETMDCMFMTSQFTGEHGGIEDWDVRKVKTASRMFYKSKFEGDISSWDFRDLDVKRSMQLLAGAIAKSRKKWPKKFR